MTFVPTRRRDAVTAAVLGLAATAVAAVAWLTAGAGVVSLDWAIYDRLIAAVRQR